MIELTTNAIEGSSYIVTAAFTDEDGNPVVPNSATWSMSDSNGTIINSRLDVVITPAASIWFVLTPTDLAVTDDVQDIYRFITIEALYDSATYGSGLSLTEEAKLDITPLINV